ncbi:ABC transporter permease [Methanocella sp. MCL-LM]|uniref:ABC transporter permease n=1 Tax=Methanocella sp. MCL-LM TaxID=3412035 RepID=UPI003C747CF3
MPVPTPAGGSSTDAAVKEQLAQAMNGTQPKFKAEFVSDNEIIVPSLMNPPVPLSQVIIAFLYIVPIFFISVFFTSSFMDEKVNRKLNILMSTPVSALDVIGGKMLPYLAFALVVIVGVTLALNGNLLLAIAIFTPIVLFIFAVYLMVALFYRTYKDQTFFSMAAITFITGYLVFPALFTGVNNLSYISPLTLAVQMYRGESFGLLEYAFSTLPMYLVFLLAMYVGVRIFNEEYLLSYGPLYRKVGDAIFLAINKRHVFTSIALLSLLLIPAVFMVQLIIVALATNIQQMFLMFVVLLVFSAMVEEIAKSAGIVMLLENGMLKSYKEVVALSFLSALGFLIGEKALLYLSLGILSDNLLMEAINDAGLLLIPLVAHFVFTSIVCVSTKKFGTKWYVVAMLLGTLVHTTYNIYNLKAAGLF